MVRVVQVPGCRHSVEVYRAPVIFIFENAEVLVQSTHFAAQRTDFPPRHAAERFVIFTEDIRSFGYIADREDAHTVNFGWLQPHEHIFVRQPCSSLNHSADLSILFRHD